MYVVERVICSPVGEVYQTRVSEKVRVPQATKGETAKMIFQSEARVESGIRQIYHLPDNGKLPEHTHLDTLPGPDLQQNPVVDMRR